MKAAANTRQLTLCFALLAGIVTCSQANAEYPGDIAAKVVFGDVEGKVNGFIDRAQNAADSLLWSAAQRARSVIEAWKNASDEITNNAFNKLDKSTQDFFNNVEKDLERIETDKDQLFSDIQKTTLQWSLLVKYLPFAAKGAELYAYGPRVIVPVGEKIIPMHLFGPKLADANLSFNDLQHKIKTNRLSDVEVVAEIDRETISFSDQSQFKRYEINYEQKPAGFFSSPKIVKRDISLWILPNALAKYKITTKVNSTKTETRSFVLDVGGKGKDKPYDMTISLPPDLKSQNWRIDTNAILNGGLHVDDLGGDHGSCSGFRRETLGPDSFTYYMDLGHAGRSDAHQNCRLTVPVIKDTPTVVDGKDVIEGSINWTDDHKIDLPNNISSYDIAIKMFNGRNYIVTNINRLPYGLLSLVDQKTSLIFRPKSPTDF